MPILVAFRRAAGCGVAAILLATSGFSFAQQFRIGQGATLSLGSGTIEAGCHDVSVDGSLLVADGSLSGARNLAATGSLFGGSGTLAFSGNLDAAGALNPQAGTILSEDGCSSTATSINGAHTFHRFVGQTDSGRQLLFPAGLTQQINSRVELLGGTARLVVRSSATDALALLRLSASGSWLVNAIDLRDVGATEDSPFIAPQDPAVYDSIDLGNSPRLLGGDPIVVPVVVPTLSLKGLLLLLLAMAALAAFHARKLTPRKFDAT